MVGASFSWPCKITTAGSTVLARIRAASLRYIRGHLRAVYFSGSRRNIYLLITSYYISKLSVQFFWGVGGCLCSRFVPLRLYRMNNSPAGWWKEGRESAKRWGGVTLVPAGCRSPGRCCGNHSHQPDGISVGEHEKDGSGSVLPGPARPKKQLRANTVPGERERESRACRKTLQSSVIRTRVHVEIQSWLCFLYHTYFGL